MIRCRDLRFSYPAESFRLEVGSFELGDGETAALVGPSGCGKTTLLNLLSGILVAESGEVSVAGAELGRLGASERQRFRIRHVGLVPQNFELLDYLTVRENILVPFRISSALRLSGEAAERCEALAARAGIGGLLERRPSQLSQGERQRAALCRGLVTSPPLILADEPTGNLDPGNQERIVDLLLEEAGRSGAAVLMITHEAGLLPRFSRTVDMMDLRGKEVAR